jgi:serine/threonine-protein kinase
MALENMGNAKLSMGQPAEALHYFELGRETCDKVLTPTHELCGLLLAGSGDAHRRLGKLDLAATEFQRSLAIEEKALGPKHPQVAAPLLGLGEVELSRKAPARAVPLLERALSIRTSQPGDGADLSDVRFALARALFATGDRTRARTLATEARDAYAKAGPQARLQGAEASAWLNSHPQGRGSP